MRRILLSLIACVLWAVPLQGQTTTLSATNFRFGGTATTNPILTSHATDCQTLSPTPPTGSICTDRDDGKVWKRLTSTWVEIGTGGYWLFDQTLTGPPSQFAKIFADLAITGTPTIGQYGILASTQFSPTADFTSYVIGNYFDVWSQSGAGIDITDMYSIYSAVYNNSSGVTTKQIALYADAERGGSGTSTTSNAIEVWVSASGSSIITNSRGLFFNQPGEQDTAQIQNHIGIEMEDQTVAGATVNWAIRYNAGLFGVKADGKVWLNSVEYTFPADNGTPGQSLITDGSGTLSWSAPAGGGDAPSSAQYLTLAVDGTLTNERVFTAGGNVEVVDGGAGSTYTVRSPNIISITIDGGGSTITTGTKGYVVARGTCTIDQVTVLSTDASATSGSIVLDVWKDTYANYPPTNADSITASAKPTLSSANKSQDSTLTGWTTSVTAGDVFGFEVESATTVTKVDMFMRCR